MKLTIHVEDEKADFFLELLSHLDFVTIEEIDIEEMTNAYRAFLDYRLAHGQANRDKVVLWKDLKKKLVSE